MQEILMTTFRVSKGFKVPIRKLPKKSCRIVDTEKLSKFWKDVGTISGMRGCYVFSLKAAKGERPFYVGQAARQSFEKECFTIHKRGDHYNIILCSSAGTPYIRFVYQEKKKGKWSASAISSVEEYLIAQAAARNSMLSNKRRLPDETWSIRGIIKAGSGNKSQAAQTLSKILGIE
jgi:hypothetical protein